MNRNEKIIFGIIMLLNMIVLFNFTTSVLVVYGSGNKYTASKVARGIWKSRVKLMSRVSGFGITKPSSGKSCVIMVSMYILIGHIIMKVLLQELFTIKMIN